MGLLDELEADHNASYANHCQISYLLEDHPDLKDEILNAINSKYSSASICRVLAQHDIEIPLSTLRRHRRGECKCP